MTRGRTAGGRVFVPGEATIRDGLQRLGLAAARRHRRRLGATTFVGVTGSGGKTTTKELIAAVLGMELRGTKTPSSENRLAVLGRTILRTRRGDAFSVAEIPAFRYGSVAEFSRLFRPSIAVVTSVGSDHRKLFRTLEVTAAEKAALVRALPDDGIAVLNADDPHVRAMADGFAGQVIWFGESPEATLRAEDVRSPWPDPLTFTLRWDGRSLPVRTRLNGRHWTPSVLAAVAVASAMGISVDRALEGVACFEPVSGRMSLVLHEGVTFVRDDVKAPLWSLHNVLSFLDDAHARRKILVLGTISDYRGSRSRTYAKVATQALAVADEVVFVGPNAPSERRLRTLDPARVRSFASVRAAADHFKLALQDGDLVVLKGSIRADHLGRIILARTTSIRCWRASCGRSGFCEDCRLLRVPERPRAA